jgi:TRAP-type uncharacterized transport system substrate-binding protein
MVESLHHRLGGIAVRLVVSLLVASIVAGFVAAILHAVPPRFVVIEAGPEGGSYYRNALMYKKVIEAGGVQVEIRPKPESLQIIDDVNAPDSDVEIGFTAQYVDREKYQNTTSAGAIEAQPLFTFYRQSLAAVQTPRDFAGLRIVMPQADSATAEAALRVLADYGITAKTAAISFRPIGDAVTALRAGTYDVGFFMLAPANDLIAAMVTDPNLRLLDYGDAPTLARLESFLSTTVIRRGIYDLEHDIPARPITMLAGTVNVVVKKTIHPAILYLLLEAMANAHRGATLVSDPGVFPTLVGTALPVDPRAKEYEKSGMPWVYRNLPLAVAGPVDYYFAFGVAQFFIFELIKSSKYVFVVITLMFEMVSLRALRRIEERTRSGHTPSRLDQTMIRLTERSLAREQQRQHAAELLQKLKAGAKAGPTDTQTPDRIG